MAGNSQNFVKQLGAEIADSLGSDFTYLRSKLELRRKVPEGYDVIVLSPASKYSPHINLAFYFGKNFDAARQIERATDGYAFPYHVQQYSLYRQPLYSGTYQGPDNWAVDITDPPKDLAQQVVAAIRGMAYPFFSEFSSMVVARDAMAADSPRCFGGLMYWRQILLLDTALNDLAHFRTWSEQLDNWTRGQANQELAKHVQAIPSVA